MWSTGPIARVTIGSDCRNGEYELPEKRARGRLFTFLRRPPSPPLPKSLGRAHSVAGVILTH